MPRCRCMTAPLLCITLGACGRGGADTTIAATDATHPATEAVAVSQPESSLAASLQGDWVLNRIPPQRMPGLSITVTIDSVSDAHYFGRLSHYFSGNVGQDPGRYAHFSDSIRHDGTLTLSMPAIGGSVPGLMMAGTLTTDTITLDRFVLGPDTISSGQHRWILVRER